MNQDCYSHPANHFSRSHHALSNLCFNMKQIFNHMIIDCKAGEITRLVVSVRLSAQVCGTYVVHHCNGTELRRAPPTCTRRPNFLSVWLSGLVRPKLCASIMLRPKFEAKVKGRDQNLTFYWHGVNDGTCMVLSSTANKSSLLKNLKVFISKGDQNGWAFKMVECLATDLF